MSSKDQIAFTKDNIETYLKELAKEYRKLGGRKLPAEIVLIGGASILINYGFRDMTTDIDAVIQSASTMKEAINHVGDRFDLPRGWLNDDFKKTTSYTTRLGQYSEHYETFYGVITVRTIAGKYLIAMKLQSGRMYKNDLSDILGILASHQKAGSSITMEMIDGAVNDLYGSWAGVSDEAKEFINNTMEDGDYSGLIAKIRETEKETRAALLKTQEAHQRKTKTEDAESIISKLKKKKEE